MQFDYSLLESKSQYHKKVITFLREEYPLFDIAQEFTIHIDNNTLQCDILCKSPLKFIIEINPKHHYEFTPHFHKTMDGFKQAQCRDELKKKWADMNEYLYIILKEEDFKKDKFKETLKEMLE
jgi:hypothetical protein